MLQQTILTVISRLKKVNIFDKMLRKFECFNEGGGGISCCLGWHLGLQWLWSHAVANPDVEVRSWDGILYLSARPDLRIRIRATGSVSN
jgi:hypothetical protein